MIDLTPLDVRKKRGDFGKGVRGYNTQEVDSFLELVAERLEELVKENLQLRERADRLSEQVTAQTGRERAVHEALVTAQQLRDEIQANAQKEAQLVVKEAQGEAREIVADAERKAMERADALHELDRRRKRFLASFRQFLERELDAINVESEREPVAEDVAIDLDLGGSRPVGLSPRPEDDIHELAKDSDEEELAEAGAPEATDSEADEEPSFAAHDAGTAPPFGNDHYPGGGGPFGEATADEEHPEVQFPDEPEEPSFPRNPEGFWGGRAPDTDSDLSTP